jgi:hypothetical protein
MVSRTGQTSSPLDFASDSFRLVPTVTVGTEAQDALRHRSVPTQEPAWRTGKRGNELMGLVLDFAGDSS